MKETLPYRIVRLEGDVWTVRPDTGELGAEEQQDLSTYLDEVRMPYQIQNGQICIPESITWESLDECLSRFYAGRAEVCPF